MKEVCLLYGATEPGQEKLSTDLLWRTGFRAPDAFCAVEFSEEKAILLLGDLECERAKKEARSGCRVERLVPFRDRVKERGEEVIESSAIVEFLRDHSVGRIILPAGAPVFLYLQLSDAGFEVEVWKEGPFYPQRQIKTPQEVACIEEVQGVVEEVVWDVVELLKRAVISTDGTLRDRRRGKITSESIRSFMNARFVQKNCLATSTIIACGDQAVDPHCDGYGPLYANLPIVLDVYPRSMKHWFWSDMSRTFFKGEPAPEASKTYEAVLDGQLMAIGMIHAGVDGKTIQTAVSELFENRGYLTGVQNGTMQGFFHSVGHGVGLDIHEDPRITIFPYILPEGSLVTVEPGLYYLGIGGVRIEDLVVVTKDGCRNLTKFPKELKDMVIP